MTPQEAECVLSENTPIRVQVDSSINLDISPSLVSLQDGSLSSNVDPCTDQTLYRPFPHTTKWSKAHPIHQVIGDPSSLEKMRLATTNECLFNSFLSSIDPMKVSEALADPEWIIAMQDEMNWFGRLKVWTLVPRAEGKSIIRTKWIFKKQER